MPCFGWPAASLRLTSKRSNVSSKGNHFAAYMNAYLQRLEPFLSDVNRICHRGIPSGSQISFGLGHGNRGGHRMGKGYSTDFRLRTLAFADAADSAREASRLMNVAPSTAIRWAKQWARTGSVEVKPAQGHSRSPLKEHETWLLDLVAREPDLTLEEIRDRRYFVSCGSQAAEVSLHASACPLSAYRPRADARHHFSRTLPPLPSILSPSRRATG